MRTLLSVVCTLVLLGSFTQAGESHWYTKVVLKNGTEFQGVVLNNRFRELEVAGRYEPVKRTSIRGAGIRLWYVRNNMGATFLPFTQVKRIIKLQSISKAELQDILTKVKDKRSTSLDKSLKALVSQKSKQRSSSSTKSAQISKAGKDYWFTNYIEATQAAIRQRKPLLIKFEGSDWCGYCVVLNRQVFDTDYYQKYGANRFVHLKLDFPKKKELPKKEKEHNEALAAFYSVRGYPSVWICAGDGYPLAKTGYQENVTPREYIQHLTTEYQKAAKRKISKKQQKEFDSDKKKLVRVIR